MLVKRKGKVAGRDVGTMGMAAAFSFNSRKTLPAGLGGAVLFANDELASRAREIRDYGRKADDGSIVEIGSYLPISEFDAAIARVQLGLLTEYVDHAENMARYLSYTLGPRAPYVPGGYQHAWHKYRIRGTSEERALLDREGVVTALSR